MTFCTPHFQNLEDTTEDMHIPAVKLCTLTYNSCQKRFQGASCTAGIANASLIGVTAIVLPFSRLFLIWV